MPTTPDAAPISAARRTAAKRLNDSSKTRVGPILGALTEESTGDRQWLRRLLGLAAGAGPHPWDVQDLEVLSRHHAPTSDDDPTRERGLHPPVALLSWLIRNLPVPVEMIPGDGPAADHRRALARRDPAKIAEALAALRRGGTGRGWHVLEGPSYPDGYFETTDALVVVEGKRAERSITTDTKWMPQRNQMLRHLDAAFEIAGRRAVYGLMIVEGSPGSTAVPETWQVAAEITRQDPAVWRSLPHRGPEERDAIRDSFLGVTTWARVVDAFGLPPALLTPLAGR